MRQQLEKKTLTPECVTIIGVFVHVITHDLLVSSRTHKEQKGAKERSSQQINVQLKIYRSGFVCLFVGWFSFHRAASCLPAVKRKTNSFRL